MDRDQTLNALRERILAFATSRLSRDHAEDLTQDVLVAATKDTGRSPRDQAQPEIHRQSAQPPMDLFTEKQPVSFLLSEVCNRTSYTILLK